MVIKSFNSKALAKLFSEGDGRKVQPKHIAKLKLILSLLNAAENVRDMDAPGMRFHALGGKMKGIYSVWVDENYRVMFRFKAGNAEDVDYGDYH